MRFDYHTQYREGFALWRSPFDRNLYALLLLGLCTLPWFMTPFMLGETAYVFILCVASLGLMSLTGLTGQVSLGHAAFIAIGAYGHAWFLSKGVPLPLSMVMAALLSAAAGLLVGIGTRYASGCTSGHGVCGLSRLSPRSLVATLSFMGAGFFIVYIVRHIV